MNTDITVTEALRWIFYILSNTNRERKEEGRRETDLPFTAIKLNQRFVYAEFLQNRDQQVIIASFIHMQSGLLKITPLGLVNKKTKGKKLI